MAFEVGKAKRATGYLLRIYTEELPSPVPSEARTRIEVIGSRGFSSLPKAVLNGLNSLEESTRKKSGGALLDVKEDKIRKLRVVSTSFAASGAEVVVSHPKRTTTGGKYPIHRIVLSLLLRHLGSEPPHRARGDVRGIAVRQGRGKYVVEVYHPETPFLEDSYPGVKKISRGRGRTDFHISGNEEDLRKFLLAFLRGGMQK